MRPYCVFIAIALLACTGTTQSAGNSGATKDQSQTMTIFDFSDSDTSPWHIQDDGVMGGKSKGAFDISEGHLTFTGNTVTKGGGFSSVLAEKDVKLADLVGVEMRVRGGGRTFEFAIDDGTRDGDREVWRRAAFPTTDTWQTVRVPFDDLKATVHGRPIAVAALDKNSIEKIGFFITDGKDGPFRLEVDWMKGF